MSPRATGRDDKETTGKGLKTYLQAFDQSVSKEKIGPDPIKLNKDLNIRKESINFYVNYTG